MEGLVQAGAFDKFNKNRQSLFNSIPSIILKSKNEHENKLLNQIDLFQNQDVDETNFLKKDEDWNTDIKLTKEFETLGFYISDHPINQYKSIFKQYNIIDYNDFENNNDILSSNIACTVLKVQEKKTQKGSTYAIIKFSDLSNVFELFVFSEIFELNREVLKEGNSLMITLIKNYSDQLKTQKKINIKKIISLKGLTEKPIKNIIFKFDKIEDLNKLKKLSREDGETNVKILVDNKDEILTLHLKDKRNINHRLINSLNLGKNVIFE